MTDTALRTRLRDPDAENRRHAVSAIAQDPPPEATELVMDALGDSEWRVRKEAVSAVVAIADRFDVIPPLIDAISQGDNVGLRNAALEVFGRLREPATQPLLDALPRVPSPAQKFVIDALGDTADTRALPALLSAANEEDDPNVSAAALDALARIGGRQAEDALRRWLQPSDPFRCMAALDGLMRLDAAVSWEELQPLLDDRMLWRAALPALGRTGRLEAAGPLIAALSDRSTQTVAEAARALVHLYDRGDPTCRTVIAEQVGVIPAAARKALRELLDAPQAPVEPAVRLLLWAHDEDALEEIVELAAHGGVAPEALAALRNWSVAAVRPLLRVYGQTRGAVRGLALELAADVTAEARWQNEPSADSVIGELRSALREALHDPDREVLMAAARSMAWWVQAEDAAQLVALTSRGPFELARTCGQALEALTPSAPEAVRDALDRVEPGGSGHAVLAQVAVQAQHPSAFEQLQAALSTGDPTSRKVAIDGLARLGDARAVERIGYALADEHEEVQTAAARALGRLQTVSSSAHSMARESLWLALQSESPSVQAAAARALGEAGDEDATERLHELVRNPHAAVAAAAIEGLRALGDPGLDELLVEALGHQDDEVVKQALAAMSELSGERTASRLALGLEHPSWDVRASTARLLGGLPDDTARSALRARLEREPDDLVRTALREALGETVE